MPDFEVREVDVDDEAQRHAWWQAAHDGETVGRPYDLYPMWELSRDWSLAGYTDLFVEESSRSRARVGITMVLPEHRGHSLGLTMKLATHRSLMGQVPECRIVTTGNADVNAHMNTVDERMGYRLVEQLLEVQKIV